MSFNQLLTIVKARWLLGTLVFSTIVLLTLVGSLLFPKNYEAEAAVVIDVKSPDPIAGMVLPGLMSASYMATQVDIIQSERVARRVMTDLGLDKNEQLQQQWRDDADGQGTFMGWLTERMLKNLDVEPSRESNVIRVNYSAADPQFAAVLANAFVRAYIDTNLDLRVEPARQYSTLFESQTKLLRERLEAAQTALSRYQREKGLIANDERMDVENQRLSDLSSQLVALQSLSSESISRQAQAGPNSPEVLGSAVVASLRTDLSRTEARLKELQARFGDAHPQVQEIKASVMELRDKIDAETQRVTKSVGITRNVSVSREAQIRSELEAQRTKVLKLKEQRDEASVLLRDVENAQKAYDNAQARLYQSSLESQSNQTNVSVLKAAFPPTEHAFPKVGLNLALAVFLGGLLAFGSMLLRELGDRRMRTVEDVHQGLDMPLIGILPKTGGKSGLLAGRKKQLALRGGLRGVPELAAPKA